MKFWPSRAFWRGFGSVLSIFPEPRRHFEMPCGYPPFQMSSSPEEAARLDAEALRGDWDKVMGDLDQACDRVPGDRRESLRRELKELFSQCRAEFDRQHPPRTNAAKPKPPCNS